MFERITGAPDAASVDVVRSRSAANDDSGVRCTTSFEPTASPTDAGKALGARIETVRGVRVRAVVSSEQRRVF